MSYFSKLISVNKNIKNIYPLLIFFNLSVLLFSLFSNAILASKFGTTILKDNLELSISISRNIVTSLGIGSLGGSVLYIVARKQNKNNKDISQYLTSIFVIQFLYSILIYSLFLSFQDQIFKYLLPNLAYGNIQIIKNFIVWTALLIILQPIFDLIASATTGLQIYGLNLIGIGIQKFSILVGVILVNTSNPQLYPISVVFGLFLSIFALSYIVYQKGISFQKWTKLNLKDIKDTFKISLPWIITSPFVNLINWMLAPLLINLGPGNYSVYLYAYLLYSLCVSVVLTPFSDAIGPALAKHKEQSELEVENKFLSRSFRLSFFIGVFVSAIIIVSNKLIISFLFFRGNLNFDSANLISKILVILSLSLCFQSTTIFLSRFFQSRISMFNYILTQLIAPLLMLAIIYAYHKNLTITHIGFVISFSSILTGLISWYRGNHLLGNKAFAIDIKLIIWSILCLIISLLLNSLVFKIVNSTVLNIIMLLFIVPISFFLFLFVASFMKINESFFIINFLREKFFSLTKKFGN